MAAMLLQADEQKWI